MQLLALFPIISIFLILRERLVKSSAIKVLLKGMIAIRIEIVTE